MNDLYKFAAKNKIRFASLRGPLTTEQLYDLSLAELNEIGLGIKKRITDLSVESLIEVTKTDPEKARFENAFEIVKDVIRDKQSAAEAAEVRRTKSIERAKILDAMNAKKDTALTKASMAELQKKLDALDVDG